jgi:folate-binding Fe-S cluster repair protein YgfZ
MTNLQLVGGVSFKKGCYTGQEIVARMEYLGKLKRRMYRATISTDTAPQPGEEVFSGGDSSQSCGQLVSAAEHPDGDYAVLVVLQIGAAEGESSLHLGSADGPVLKLESLPYAFAED